MFTESQLLAAAREIKDEVIPLANSATRVGSMLEELVRASTKPYDSSATYQVGQSTLFNRLVCRCVQAAGIGESPAMTPAKWFVPPDVRYIDPIGFITTYTNFTNDFTADFK